MEFEGQVRNPLIIVPALSDILDCGQSGQRSSVPIPNQGNGDITPDDTAILSDITLDQPIPRDLSGEHLFHMTVARTQIFGVSYRAPAKTTQLRRRISQEITEGLIHVREAVVYAFQGRSDGRLFKEAAEQILAAAECQIGIFQFRSALANAIFEFRSGFAQRLAGRLLTRNVTGSGKDQTAVGYGKTFPLEPVIRAVLCPIAVLERENPSASLEI